MEERWPPVYDAEDLKREIERLSRHPELAATTFYGWRRDRAIEAPSDICQGDVVRLEANLPFLGENGEPMIEDEPTRYWLVIGNSCDLDRSLEDVPWTHLAPILLVAEDEVNPGEREALKRYAIVKRFHVPPWSEESRDTLPIVDLLRIIPVHRGVFVSSKAIVEARLSRGSWMMLNACLVRFLARDDGRFDL